MTWIALQLWQLVFFVSCVRVGSEGYAALCVVCKNENSYIREWLNYHKCLGFSKIYVYDHSSATPLNLTVGDYIQDGTVEYQYFAADHVRYAEGYTTNLQRFLTTVQGQSYKHCIETHGSKHTFMGFIDMDEFLVFHDHSMHNITQFLSRYEAYAGVSLYWILLGSSGHKRRPKGMVIKNYLKCVPRRHKYHTQFKSFVNLKFQPTMYSPHRALFNVSTGYLVDENMVRIATGRNKNCTHRFAAVYHYATKSEQDFHNKLRQGGGAGVTRPKNYLHQLDKRANETCLDAVRTYESLCHHKDATNVTA